MDIAGFGFLEFDRFLALTINVVEIAATNLTMFGNCMAGFAYSEVRMGLPVASGPEAAPIKPQLERNPRLEFQTPVPVRYGVFRHRIDHGLESPTPLTDLGSYQLTFQCWNCRSSLRARPAITSAPRSV